MLAVFSPPQVCRLRLVTEFLPPQLRHLLWSLVQLSSPWVPTLDSAPVRCSVHICQSKEYLNLNKIRPCVTCPVWTYGSCGVNSGKPFTENVCPEGLLSGLGVSSLMPACTAWLNSRVACRKMGFKASMGCHHCPASVRGFSSPAHTQPAPQPVVLCQAQRQTCSEPGSAIGLPRLCPAALYSLVEGVDMNRIHRERQRHVFKQANIYCELLV